MWKTESWTPLFLSGLVRSTVRAQFGNTRMSQFPIIQSICVNVVITL